MRADCFTDAIAASPRVFVIGVAGDSGSGKTTFTGAIRAIFGEHLVTTVTLDDYHRYDRQERAARGITPLVPWANNLELLEDHVRRMRAGETVEKPVYRHQDGTFGPPVPFTPGRILILEGLHTLFTPGLRDLLDFSLFVDPEPGVKRLWKIRRDVEARGYREEEVLAELRERAFDYQEHVAPQRRFADAVIRVAFSKYGEAAAREKDVYQVTLSQVMPEERIRDTDLSLDLVSLLTLSERPFLMEYRLEEMDGRRTGALTFDGELSRAMVQRLETSIERQTRVPVTIFRHRDYVTAGEIAQLILAWRIINRRIFLEGNAC